MRQLTLIPSLWQQVCTFDNLLLAYTKARQGKRQRPDVALFSYHLESALFRLLDELSTGRYQPGLYRAFNIYDQKPRVISVAPFRDRVVHHALMNILEPILDRYLIDTCFACRKGKGVHAAVNHYQSECRRYRYVLKMDVQRYFPSIDHQTLLLQLKSIGLETPLFATFERIVTQCNTLMFQGKGLPIGNLTSQILANLYLNPLDQSICQLNDVCYLRYVDDLFVLGNDKKRLWQIKQQCIDMLATLKLVLHSNKSHIFRTTEKVDVLGYKVTPDKRWLRNQNGYRMQRKLKQMQQDFGNGTLSLEKAKASMMSWHGHASHGDTQGLASILFDNAVFQKG